MHPSCDWDSLETTTKKKKVNCAGMKLQKNTEKAFVSKVQQELPLY